MSYYGFNANRLGAMVVALGLSLALAACGGSNEDPVSKATEAPESDGTGTTLSSTEATKPQTALLKLPAGDVSILLRPDLAPNHVARFRELSSRGFYDNTPFHRVIPGFMAQGGDPTGTGGGGSNLPDLKAEFSSAPFGRGTIAAARTGDPDSANSQFFICFDNSGCGHLRGQYTVWGQVQSGMEHVDALKKGPPGSGIVQGPDRIVSFKAVE